MKRFLILVLGILCLFGCNFGAKTNYGKQLPPEVVAWLKQFNVSEFIDSTDVKTINIKIFQTLGDGEGLATTCSSEKYGWYNGDVVYYLSVDHDLVYDNKIIKEKVYMVGTYTYETKGGSRATVPVYVYDFSTVKWFVESVKSVK